MTQEQSSKKKNSKTYLSAVLFHEIAIGFSDLTAFAQRIIAIDVIQEFATDKVLRQREGIRQTLQRRVLISRRTKKSQNREE
jgi:hypothetical protein